MALGLVNWVPIRYFGDAERTGGPWGTLAQEEAARTAARRCADATRREAILREESMLNGYDE